MNTKQLQYVLALAREGTFSRAAEKLNISQPSLSQYIKKIENSLGIEIFDRTNGHVKLTDAGRIYVETGRRILDAEHQMEVRLSDLRQNKTGSLVVGAAPYRAATMMPAIAERFAARYPGMHLIVHEGTTAELEEGMARGDFDLCLTMLPVDQRLFCCEKVMEEELILAVPAGREPFPAETMPDRMFPAVDVSVLDHTRMVMLTELQFMQRQLRSLMEKHGLEISPAAVVKSLEAQLEMVRAGIGMAMMPSGIERFCGRDGREVTFYSFKQELPRREVAVIWRKDRALSGVTEELKRIILEFRW